MTRCCCWCCCRCCYGSSAVAHDMNSCLLNLSLSLLQGSSRERNQRCRLGRRGAQLELLAMPKQCPGEPVCEGLGVPGPHCVVHTPTWGCIKPESKGAVSEHTALSGLSQVILGEKLGPPKRGRRCSGREREREGQAIPKTTLHHSKGHTGTHYLITEGFC